MCGVAGILGETRVGDEERVRAMLDVMPHRGPDAARVQTLQGAVVGFRRLSIIDLSERSMQPLTSRHSSCVMVFNGEIYNFKELRSELAGRHRFETTGDAEVLMAAWDEWGERCLERLNGMFGLCIYDPLTRRAFFARDRFGQKPLYLARHGDQLLFASEVKALLAGGVPARPDMTVWSRYLLHASYDDSTDTYFDGVTQLGPGECAWYEPGRELRRRRYYDLRTHAPQVRAVGVDEAADETRELLRDVARLHMRSDVPVGVSLSGGLDSSALLASLDLSQRLHEDVQCVSVDFGGDLSERPWIEAAACYHGLSASIEGYTPEAFYADIMPLMWHLEGPLGGLMNCALIPVMAAARKQGIVVVQDGTGLDEAFGGYRNHHDLHLGTLLAEGGADADAAVRAYADNWSVTPQAARSAAALAMSGAVTSIDGTVPVRPDLLTARVHEQCGDKPPPGSRSADVRAALIDYLQVRKIPRNTRMKDRLSMAFGLELRLPFLDHRLVEHALSLPPEYYFLHGRTKSIVREALRGAMADDVRVARKRSIQAPQGPWLRREPMVGFVRQLINSERFADRGLFKQSAVIDAFDQFVSGADDNSFFVWQWINVEAWFRTFVDRSPFADPEPLDRTFDYRFDGLASSAA